VAKVAVLTSVCGTAQWLAEAMLSLATSGADYMAYITANGQREWETCWQIGEMLGERVMMRAYSETVPLASSLNAMLTGVSEPYTVRLDPDDSFPPGALCALLDAVERADQGRMAFGHYRDFGEVDRLIHCQRPTARALYEHSVGPYCLLGPTRAFRELGGWRDVAYEDWDLTIRLVAAGYTIVALDRVVLLHRVRKAGRLAQILPAHQKHLAELRKLNFDFFRRAGVIA
jgi:GT2 family glycosyltransferase